MDNAASSDTVTMTLPRGAVERLRSAASKAAVDSELAAKGAAKFGPKTKRNQTHVDQCASTAEMWWAVARSCCAALATEQVAT